MLIVSILLSFLLLFIESVRCKSKGGVSTLLIALLFNLVFVNGWVFLSLFELDFEIQDGRVGLCLLLNNSVWLIILIAEKLFSSNNKTNNSELKVSKEEIKAVYLLMLMTIIIGIYYISQVGVSLLAEDVEWARHTAKKGRGYINMFVTRGLLLAIVMMFILYKLNKINLSRLIFFMGLVAVIQLATGFRSYLINTLVIICIVVANMNKTYRHSYLLVLVAIGGILFFGVTMYKFRAQIYDFDLISVIEKAWSFIHHRVVMENPRIIMKQIFMVDMYGFSYGKTYFWDLYAGLPGPGYGYGDMLFIWLAGNNPIAGIAPLSPSLIGESYINFGYLGVCLGSVASFMIFRLVDRINQKSILGVASRSILTLLVAETVFLGIGTMFVSRVMTTLVFILIFIAIVRILKLFSSHHSYE